MSDVGQWLTGLGLEQYQQLFVEQAIDVGVLPALTDDDLKGLGIPLGHRKRLLNAIVELGDVGGANATLPTTKAAPAERRHVTVLFCDLVGSTQLSTELDPEALSVLLADYRRCCNGAITRWGGYVAKYMGDGVLAYFGWPQAHDDDADAAVRAALELVRAVGGLAAPGAGAHLATRAGIATGEVESRDIFLSANSRLYRFSPRSGRAMATDGKEPVASFIPGQERRSATTASRKRR